MIREQKYKYITGSVQKVRGHGLIIIFLEYYSDKFSKKKMTTAIYTHSYCCYDNAD